MGARKYHKWKARKNDWVCTRCGLVKALGKGARKGTSVVSYKLAGTTEWFSGKAPKCVEEDS